MKRGVLTVAVALAAAAGIPTAASAVETRTDVRTIQDLDGDNLLEPAPGENHTVIGAPEGFRPPAGGSILNFLQLSDFQMVDEESPGRVEFLDTTQRAPGANPFSAAYRPQEALTTQVTESMVRQVRNTRSPVTSADPALSVLTGDNADSQQYNETRWFIDVLDGDKVVDPDSGVPARGCNPTPGNPYDGVRGGGNIGYYEPDASAGEDGDGYSPDRAENLRETGRDVTVRDFPRLLEDAQRPFRSLGLGMPWYSAFGNHDALIQGNSPEAFVGPLGTSGENVNPAFDALVRGCLKPSRLPSGTRPLQFIADPGAVLGASAPLIVPPDPRRCYVAKDELAGGAGASPPCTSGGWIQQHFRTTGTPVGHGFAPTASLSAGQQQAGLGRPPLAVANHDGYYSFSPRQGLRFVVLDTITDECGVPVCAEGSLDDTQFIWLTGQLQRAAASGEYVVTFAHHTLRTMRSPTTDATELPIHRGERVDRRSRQPQLADGGATLEELFCIAPNLVAHVTGHEHENYVEQHRCAQDSPPTPGTNTFLNISSAAHIDWPQQVRMIELVDNGDDTMSLVLTMIDHAGPANPGDAAGEQVLKLSSIARELSYNDYQGSRGARGEPSDRNVIAVVDKPWPYAGDAYSDPLP